MTKPEPQLPFCDTSSNREFFCQGQIKHLKSFSLVNIKGALFDARKNILAKKSMEQLSRAAAEWAEDHLP